MGKPGLITTVGEKQIYLKGEKDMEEILEKIHDDFAFYKEKVDQCAGYFVKERFEDIKYKFDNSIINKMHNLGIEINDFSNYVADLCGGDESKLLFILVLAYSVEV